MHPERPERGSNDDTGNAATDGATPQARRARGRVGWPREALSLSVGSRRIGDGTDAVAHERGRFLPRAGLRGGEGRQRRVPRPRCDGLRRARAELRLVLVRLDGFLAGQGVARKVGRRHAHLPFGSARTALALHVPIRGPEPVFVQDRRVARRNELGATRREPRRLDRARSTAGRARPAECGRHPPHRLVDHRRGAGGVARPSERRRCREQRDHRPALLPLALLP